MSETESETQTTPETRTEIHNVETRTDDGGAVESYNVHFTVYDFETDEFVGDFTVDYTRTRYGTFTASEYKTVRAAGGIYAEGAEPSGGLLMHCADLAAKETGDEIAHHFR